MNVTLRLDNNDLRGLVAEALQSRMEDRVLDMRPAWPNVLTEIYGVEAELFANEGKTAEEPEWAPLKNGGKRFHGGMGYADWKEMMYGTKKLHLTGKLERMLTGQDGTAHVDARRADKLIFGTDYRTYSGVPGRPRSPQDKLTGDLGGITAEGRKDYYPMQARTPIRLDKQSAKRIAEPIVDHLTDGRRS